MASASSINSTSNANGAMSNHHNHQHAPNPPPRSHSRPNQPPPPPPLPSVPPVPPTRDSSIAISRTTIANARHNATTVPPSPPHPTFSHNNNPSAPNVVATNAPPSGVVTKDNTGGFLSPFVALFKPITDLPPPDIFMNKPKTYPSQKLQQKQSHSP